MANNATSKMIIIRGFDCDKYKAAIINYKVTYFLYHLQKINICRFLLLIPHQT